MKTILTLATGVFMIPLIILAQVTGEWMVIAIIGLVAWGMLAALWVMVRWLMVELCQAITTWCDKANRLAQAPIKPEGADDERSRAH